MRWSRLCCELQAPAAYRHCGTLSAVLPTMPQGRRTFMNELIYQTPLSPLGSQLSVWAECLFADPIADIAVLGSPDNQELSNEADAYEALVEFGTALRIADSPEEGRGWMLSLENKWFDCTVRYMKRVDGDLIVSDADQPVALGMSGSPIISDEGAAIGIVCLGSNQVGCKNPRLVRDLPGWILRGTCI